MAESQTPALTRQERFGALYEEYRALYSLATLRIGSLDRRSSVTIAVLGTFLASFAQVGADGQITLLLGGPLALIWLVRSTVIHAQSFEDAIRRIDEIERSVNTLGGEQLMFMREVVTDYCLWWEPQVCQRMGQAQVPREVLGRACRRMAERQNEVPDILLENGDPVQVESPAVRDAQIPEALHRRSPKMPIRPPFASRRGTYTAPSQPLRSCPEPPRVRQ